MDQETIYFEDPLEAAKHWVKEGATFIHIVDLNGAVEGRPVHMREVESICKGTGLSVELGGGLRSVESVDAALNLGVLRVVIGTAAYDNQEFLRELCAKFPGKIVVGIDARNGKVAVKGWKETTSMDAMELAKRCEADGASRIIYTDISRDGTRTVKLRSKAGKKQLPWMPWSWRSAAKPTAPRESSTPISAATARAKGLMWRRPSN